MINVAIVDDELAERQKICECLEFMEKGEKQFFVRQFESADEFLVKYEPIYDIIFMDIQMRGTNGINAAASLRKIDKTVIIIFVTNMAQLAVKGYEVDALDFVVKPINKLTFALKFKRALGRLANQPDDKILIKSEGDLLSVSAKAVRYAEVDGHYIVYQTPDGEYREYTTLSAAEKKLNANGIFERCNRGQLVNLRYVTAIKKDFVIVDGTELVIARTQRNAFIKAFADYMGGGYN